MAGLGDSTRDRLRARGVAAWARIHRSWAWRHKFKCFGSVMGAAGYVQNHYAQIGRFLPPRFEGTLLGTAGLIVFTFGLLEMFTPPDPP